MNLDEPSKNSTIEKNGFRAETAFCIYDAVVANDALTACKTYDAVAAFMIEPDQYEADCA